MKVFISWSGKISFEVAKVLKEWIPYVIQEITPYFSSDDIDKGARWSIDIAKALEEAEFGILCVTKENINSAWLNFEAGALSKAIDRSKVCPFLFNLQPSDISNSPILQFQMTRVDRDDMYKLFKSMNKALGENALEERRLKKMFELSWNGIDTALKGIEDISVEDAEKKKEKSLNQQKILEEMLDLLRSQQVMLCNPEQFIPVDIIKDMNSLLKRDHEIYNNVIRRLFIQSEKIRRQLSTLEEVIKKCDFDEAPAIDEYIGMTNKLVIIELELFERLGFNEILESNKRFFNDKF